MHPSAGCGVTSARVRATNSHRQPAQANPIINTAMRAATAAGQSRTDLAMVVSRVRTFARSSVDRRTGGVARIPPHPVSEFVRSQVGNTQPRVILVSGRGLPG